MEYALILAAVFLISPFVLRLASSQNEKHKKTLKNVFKAILIFQIVMGFLNWEKFYGPGRSGFELAVAYPSSFLLLYFIFTFVQILLLIFGKYYSTLVVWVNFANSVLIFASLIKISSILGYQSVSFASIGTVFLTLFGNVVSLMYINKDRYLLKKYIK